MDSRDDNSESVEKLVEIPNLAEALEGEQFHQFLDHIPFGVAVSNLEGDEVVIYANPVFEKLTGTAVAKLQGQPWTVIATDLVRQGDDLHLSAAITSADEYIGRFKSSDANGAGRIDAWSNRISDDTGTPIYRLVALADVLDGEIDQEVLTKELMDKDVMLKELQHRVKNNLQMITALVRLESRNLQSESVPDRFDRLAGRIDALALLYRSLSDEEKGETVDLGVYVSQIASSVMSAHAVEGIRLALKVDTWPVSINAAMPAGLVVNELMTNALKHAFVGRETGEITVESIVDDSGCVVTVADNGIGLQPGMVWPKPGKLSALIVRSLEQNVKAKVTLETSPETGVRVRLFFARELAVSA